MIIRSSVGPLMVCLFFQNLTPAHKLINDNRRKRLEDEYAATASNTAFVTNNTNNNNPEQPGGQLYTQLAGMCTSLLRNEQTLLSMLQNQTGRGNQGNQHFLCLSNQILYKPISHLHK